MGRDDFGILFTCIGRRVSLLESFRRAARQLRLKARFLGTDTSELSAAVQLCDKGILVRPTTDPSYIRQILSIVRSEGVRLLVPTVDLDLKVLAENKRRFAAAGCSVLVSGRDVIGTCQDKRRSYRFLRANGFDTPVTMSIKSALASRRLKWPVFLKPWDGYASRGRAVARNREELLFYAKRVPNPICQEYVEGTEHTCDVYVDFGMRVRCVVPRKRVEVRAGEVSKGQVVKDLRIMTEAAKVVEALGAGPGVITIQLFVTPDDTLKFIEINPRFGGGVPLSIKAGANFPKWILQEVISEEPRIRFDGFRDGLIMLRYDSEVWYEKSRTSAVST